MICTICGSDKHRASKCPWGPAGAMLGAFMLSGCAVSVSVPPDTLCSLPRPAAHLNDTPGTIAAQAAAAVRWDSRCTVFGAWGAR